MVSGYCPKVRKCCIVFMQRHEKQAGAELCQAQISLSYLQPTYFLAYLLTELPTYFLAFLLDCFLPCFLHCLVTCVLACLIACSLGELFASWLAYLPTYFLLPRLLGFLLFFCAILQSCFLAFLPSFLLLTTCYLLLST